jgi:hypothetical protein
MRKVENPPVDVTDDKMMMSLGIRLKNLASRDTSVWTKTIKEKEELKKAKNSDFSTFSSKWGYSKRIIPVYSKLIITIKPNSKNIITDKHGNKHIKTTFSHKCGQSDIVKILSNYDGVVKYSWNGRDYTTGLPYWK